MRERSRGISAFFDRGFIYFAQIKHANLR